MKTIEHFPLGDSEAKWQTEVHKLVCTEVCTTVLVSTVPPQRVVLDYLTVHGYSATAESFAKSTGQHLQEQVSSIRNRQSLFNAILD